VEFFDRRRTNKRIAAALGGTPREFKQEAKAKAKQQKIFAKKNKAYEEQNLEKMTAAYKPQTLSWEEHIVNTPKKAPKQAPKQIKRNQGN
jgi:hypothetical protein